jgi:hypothetical protein
MRQSPDQKRSLDKAIPLIYERDGSTHGFYI